MSRPSFKVLGRLGNVEKEIFIPLSIQLKDGRELKYHAEKKSGGTAGGFYVDVDGRKYMAKFSSYDSSPAEKKKLVPRSEYYEVMLNNIFRAALGEKAAPQETLVGHYSDEESHYPCFVASEVPGFRSLSSFGREEILGYANEEDEKERKLHRAKFNHFFPLICLVMNDDLYDDNFGVDGEGNPINIDLGLTPPFLFAQQQENIHAVDQLASYISHNNPYGGQHFRRKFFEDVSYASLLDGVKLVLENSDKILAEVVEIMKKISQDDSIIAEEKTQILEDFALIQMSLSKRIDYLKTHFTKDLKTDRTEATEIKWREHPKFREVFESSRQFERKTAMEAAQENIRGFAKILGIEGDDLFEIKKQILAADISDKQDELKKFAKENWALHIAAMSSDGQMAEWLLDNNIADISQRYMKRAHNIEHRAHTPLTIAVATFYDKRADGISDVAATKAMIERLRKKFFEENPQAKEAGYETNPENIWPLRATKLSFERYQQEHAFRAHSAERLQQEQQKTH